MAYALEHGSAGNENGEPYRVVQAVPPPPPSPVSDFEIADILVKLQRFVDETARQAEQEAQAVVRAAHFEAFRLVDEAKQQAAEITANATAAASAEAATQHPVANEAIAQLSAALEEFAGSNNALVWQLAQLRDTLASPPPVVTLPASTYPTIPPPPSSPYVA